MNTQIVILSPTDLADDSMIRSDLLVNMLSVT